MKIHFNFTIITSYKKWKHWIKKGLLSEIAYFSIQSLILFCYVLSGEQNPLMNIFRETIIRNCRFLIHKMHHFFLQSNEIPFFARFVIVLRIELIRPFDKNIIKQMMPRCHAKSWFILYKKRYYNWIEKRQQKHISFMKRPINWFIQMQLIRNDMIFYLYSILKCLSCKCFKSAVHYKFLLSRTISYV